jgi:ATP-dependent Clp protease ATP-binding subunit ClpC
MFCYLDWHYFIIWTKLLTLWRNITLFPFYYFSIPLHLRTLFAPWKKQLVRKKPGFHPTDIFYVVTFNFLSRLIAAIVRIITIICGLYLIVLFFFLFAIPAFIWVLIPFLTLPLYLFGIGKKKDPVSTIIKRSGGNPYTLLINLLKSKEGQFVILRLGLEPKEVFARLLPYAKKSTSSSPLLDALNMKNLSLADLFEMLAISYLPFKNILEEKNLKSEDVLNAALWYEKKQNLVKPPLFMDLAQIKSLPGIGVEWAYGYTVEFDKYAKDLTKNYSIFPLLLGREKEIKEIERILSKTQNNNVIIVGESGTARHALVETLAHRIFSGFCPPLLSHKRILSLDMPAVLSVAPTLLEVKGIMEKLLAEASFAGNIITFIDELDKYCSSQPGRTDTADVIAKFAVSSVGFIGITTPENYHKYLATNPVLAPLFEKVEVNEPDRETVITELELTIVPVLEQKYSLTITYPAISKTLENAERYISNKPYPAKAIDLLDESCLFAKTIEANALLPIHIDRFLSQKLEISLGEIGKSEKEKLSRLEEKIHQRVVNQEKAISVISSALRRRRLAVSSSKKPIGSFLFLGPTGVGKTETAKALCQIYFGGEKKMIRFDMSQYQKEEGLERLIGSVRTGTPGELTSKLKDNPFSLLLFDEFEKSVPEVYNLFLTLFDEGYIVDSNGKRIDARNTIIIATSNAGAEFIRENINMGVKDEQLQKILVEYVLNQGIFSPELINRFDAVVVFSPLSEGHLREVAKLQLLTLNKRLADKKVSVAITPELIKKLAIVGHDRQFGGRALSRVIAEKIEDVIAQKLLAGTAKKGEAIKIDL